MNITNFEFIQSVFESLCGLLCVICILIITLNGTNKVNRQLIRIFESIFLLLICDSVSYIFRGNLDTLSIAGARIGNFGAFFFSILGVYMSLHYVDAVLEKCNISISRKYIRVGDACVGLSFFLLMINIVTNWMYHFDGENYYHRSVGWYAYVTLLLLTMCVMIIVCIRHRKLMPKGLYVTLMVYMISPAVLTVVQMFFYGYSIVYSGCVISLTAVMISYLKNNAKEKKQMGKENYVQRNFILTVTMFISMVVLLSVSIISCVISIQKMAGEQSKGISILIGNRICDSIEREFAAPIITSRTMSYDYNLKQNFIKSVNESKESVEQEVSAYLASISNNFGYQMCFAVCDGTKAYYTPTGIGRLLELEPSGHDQWYHKLYNSDVEYMLNDDTDIDNDGKLAVFINTKILGDQGEFLGACGVGVEMKQLQELIGQMEEENNVSIILVDKDGLVMAASESEWIEQERVSELDLENLPENEFSIEKTDKSMTMVKYLSALDWYLVIRDHNPNHISVSENIAPSLVIFGTGIFIMGSIFWILYTRERKTMHELEEKSRISMTDRLTGMRNRRAYEDDIDRLTGNVLPKNLMVIMLDINGLKTVNDTIGHEAGDELIQGAADCISKVFDRLGRIYRTGGDEFIVIANLEQEHLQEVMTQLDKVTNSWMGTVVTDLSVSKGVAFVAEMDEEDKQIHALVKLADKRMYLDKNEYYRRTGKNRRMTW